MDKIKRADLHNNRKYKNNKNEQIDLSLSQYNITLIGSKNITEDIKEFYKHFNLFERMYIRPLLNATKYFVKNRELLRLRRTYIFHSQKYIFKAG